jgi:hypothetical protein
LKSESLSVYIDLIKSVEDNETVKNVKKTNNNDIEHKRYNIKDLHNLNIDNLINVLNDYKKKSDKPRELLDRILNPLLDRTTTID